MKWARALGAVLAVGLFVLVCAAPAGAGGRLGWLRRCSPGPSECAVPCRAECLCSQCFAGGYYDPVPCDLYTGNGSAWTKVTGPGAQGCYFNSLDAVIAGEGPN